MGDAGEAGVVAIVHKIIGEECGSAAGSSRPKQEIIYDYREG